jgi:hypothetical protein
VDQVEVMRDTSKLKKWKVKSGDKKGFSSWHVVSPKDYKIACCDCGLTHGYQFRIRKGYLEIRVRRARNYTAAIRRQHKHVCTKAK